jgi:hypothetical protein
MFLLFNFSYLTIEIRSGEKSRAERDDQWDYMIRVIAVISSYWDRTGQDRTGQDRTGQDRTGQDRTGQDRTGQDRTGQDWTAQDMRS